MRSSQFRDERVAVGANHDVHILHARTLKCVEDVGNERPAQHRNERFRNTRLQTRTAPGHENDGISYLQHFKSRNISSVPKVEPIAAEL